MKLYIDPGTGSMLFTILIAIIGSLVYLLRNLKLRMGSMLHRGRKGDPDRRKLPLVLFTDSKRYWNIFSLLCDELEKRGQEAVYMTESPDDPALQTRYEHIRTEFIGEGNIAYAKLNMLQAGMLVSSTPGLDVYQWKRSREVDWYVHIQHAANDIAMYRMFGTDYFDAILLSGQYQIDQVRALEKLRGLPAKELELVGIPYMDAMKERLSKADPLPPHERTVLLAPSWGKSGMLTRFGSRIIDALLATGYHVIIRPHPQSYTSEKKMLEDLKAAYPASPQLEWNRDNDNFEVLRRSDLLISDFSGVIFDFSLVFDKPVICADTSYDPSPYDIAWLDGKTWTFETLPKLGGTITEETFPRLKEMIDECIEDPKYQAARDQARRETWVYPGEGVQRTVDYICGKLAELQKKSADA